MIRDQLRRIWASAGGGGPIFQDAEFVWAEVRLDRRGTAAQLPLGCTVARPATGIVFLARYAHTTFGSVYSEAGLLVRIRHLGRRAVHCPWMLVDDDVAMIAGRELLGYPKKLGSMELSIADDHFEGHATRRGVELLRMRARFGEAVSDPPPILGQRVINVRGTPGLLGLGLVQFTPQERVVHARRAEVELEVGGSERDPLGRFGISTVLSGWWSRIHIGVDRYPVGIGPVSPLYLLRSWPFRYT